MKCRANKGITLWLVVVAFSMSSLAFGQTPGQRLVAVEAMATIPAGNVQQAKQEALSKALRLAVEQVLKELVLPEKLQSANSVLAIADRFANIEAVQSEQTQGDTYVLKASVTVFVLQAPEGKEALLPKLRAMGLVPSWRLMVVIPETHLRRPRIPDPAAETEIVRQLVEAGFKVVDQASIRPIRYSPEVERALEGDIAVLRQLGRRFGVDIVIIGEAFSDLVGRTPIHDPILKTTTELVSCRARVEARAVRVDTGEIVAADGVHVSGAEATEELASKKALQNAGAKLAAQLIPKIAALPMPRVRIVKVIISGWKSRQEAGRFEEALRHLPQIRSVIHLDFTGNTNICEVEMEVMEATKLAALLEQHPSLKPFNIVIVNDSPGKVEGRIRNQPTTKRGK